MNKRNLKIALAEINVILEEVMPQKQMEKIPKKFIKFIQDNRDKNHNFIYDRNKELYEQNLINETKTLLGVIYINYLANEEEKAKAIQKLNDNEIKYLEEIDEKYSVDNLFKERKSKIIEENEAEKIEQNNLPMEYHESLIRKVISFIKNIFKKGKKRA